MNKVANVLKLFFLAFKESVMDRYLGMASALAYKELLAIGPLIGFILYITAKVWGQETMHNEVIPLLKNTFTPQLTIVITYMLSSKLHGEVTSLTSLSILSSVYLLWATKGYFGQVKQTIDSTWNKRRYEFGLIPYFKRALKSFKSAGVTTLIVLVFIFIRLLLPLPDSINSENFWIVKLSELIMGFAIVTIIKTFYFTFIPPVKCYWKHVIPAAVLNAVLFLIGREIMMTHFSERPDADTAESILMVLLWFYYSNAVFIYSAEFNKLYVSQVQNIDYKGLHFDN